MDLNCEIVALQMPVVFTRDGTHDPNGMLFVPKAHAPLVKWARDRWADHDALLPRLHVRRERVQLVVDALPRLAEMLGRLRTGPVADREFLAELAGREFVGLPNEPDEHSQVGATGRDRAVRTNVEATLDELRIALADVGGDSTRLIGAGPEERATWSVHWREQLRQLDAAIARWFVDLEADPTRSLAGCLPRLMKASGMDRKRIERLLLNDHRVDVTHLGSAAPGYDRVNPMRPLPIVQPLVLRVHVGARLTVRLHNEITDRRVGWHVQGDGIGGPNKAGVRHGDGSHVGDNPDSTVAPGERRVYTYQARHEGIWPINDLADVRGNEAGSNAHGLFGALIVEPAGVTWHDPVTGEDLTGKPWGVGLYVDVRRPPGSEPDYDHVPLADRPEFVDFYQPGEHPHSFREFTVFFHDEPEWHSGSHTGEGHSLMPLSLRAEPMTHRLPIAMRRLVERTSVAPAPGQVGIDRTAFTARLGPDLDEQFWTARTPEGEYLERVAGEEQHHSSWLFGDPVTPILRAYAGDPCRVRLIHAGVKETHVFHLHVHQWRAIPQDTAPPSVTGVDEHGTPRPKGSQLLDAITIGPQTAVTIDPLYGSGSRQHAFGDIIWHCHLYPHFHHGMWGLWRSFDQLVDGSRALPDGQPCEALQPLPGRAPFSPPARAPFPPPVSKGFPWFIDGVYPMKSPPPPAAIEEHRNGRRRLLGMPPHTADERAAMAPGCVDGSAPGALFVDLDERARIWNQRAGLPAPRLVRYEIEMLATTITYNADGWHDQRGHCYRLRAATISEWRPGSAGGSYEVTRQQSFEYGPSWNPEPCFPRANHGDIVELRLHNQVGTFEADGFDHTQLPVECGLHVHLVKFDVLAADGSSTGWNYLSGASCREAVGGDGPGERRTVSLHRWIVDEEFGPIFFHDHLLANFRQKHGLFAAMIAEPYGSQWWRADDQDLVAWSEPEAVVVPPKESGVPPFRDACLMIGDFVPLLDQAGRPINPPSVLSGADDPGSMAMNYRSAPLTHRGDDPSLWFSVAARSTPNLAGLPGEPDTPIFRCYPGERVRLRLAQGAHEEQHSFVMHGTRWRKDWGNPASPLANQQTIGLSEAFTLELGEEHSPLAPGDHLWKLASIDDLWTGCWGYLRVLDPRPEHFATWSPLPDLERDPTAAVAAMRAVSATPPRPLPGPAGEIDPRVRTYVVAARRREHEYRGGHLTDPWGLHYDVVEFDQDEYDMARRGGTWRPRGAILGEPDRPLVLRARRGEWVRIILVNDLGASAADGAGSLPPFGVEPAPPRLPLESLDERGRPDRRTVSDRVSLHASLLRYDVRTADGSNVGHNLDGTVGSGGIGDSDGGHGHGDGGAVVFRAGQHGGRDNWTTMWWYADEHLAPAHAADGPGSVCLLEDLADVRNHHHHGLVGALVVLPGDVSPYRDHASTEADGWCGTTAELRLDAGACSVGAAGSVVATDVVAFLHNGVRLFVDGDPAVPVVDRLTADDPEDSGWQAISLRSAPVHRGRPSRGPKSPPLAVVPRQVPVWLNVLGAGDKPRQQTVTVHGQAWQHAPWVPGGPWMGAESGVATGWARTLVLRTRRRGDHVLRTGVFLWGTEQGMWTTLRVR